MFQFLIGKVETIPTVITTTIMSGMFQFLIGKVETSAVQYLTPDLAKSFNSS